MPLFFDALPCPEAQIKNVEKRSAKAFHIYRKKRDFYYIIWYNIASKKARMHWSALYFNAKMQIEGRDMPAVQMRMKRKRS